MFLNTFEVANFTPAALDGPSSASGQHRAHINVIEGDGASAADACRNLAEQRVGKRLLHRNNVGDFETGQHRAHAAGNIEADPAGRHHTALVWVKRRHAANGKAVAPVGIRHGIGRLYNPGQRRDIGRLFVDLVVHFADQVFVGIDDRWHPHRAVRLNAPSYSVDTREPAGVHLSALSYVHDATCRPHAVGFLRDP